MSSKAAAVAKPPVATRAPNAVERGPRDPAAMPLAGGGIARSPSGCACGGACPRCQAAALQRKPRISTPGDRFEREADDVADRVMRMARPVAIGSASQDVQRKCPSCDDEESAPVQREA